jgi:polygalacturonase
MTKQRYCRREFMARAGELAAIGWLARPALGDGWDDMRQILDRIKPPVFPDREFDVTRYGAVADGKTACTGAIARAIDECSRAGGGRVTFPAGVWLTGAIHLKSNVNLRVPEGATVKFIPDPKLYLPLVQTRWEGTELMNYSPLIYCDGQANIAVTGGGVLDGQADCDHWWPWSGTAACKPKPGDANARAGRDSLADMGAKDVPAEKRVFGEGFYLRPPLLQPCRSKNVLIEGVTLLNSPMWVVTPLYCENVTIRGV